MRPMGVPRHDPTSLSPARTHETPTNPEPDTTTREVNHPIRGRPTTAVCRVRGGQRQRLSCYLSGGCADRDLGRNGGRAGRSGYPGGGCVRTRYGRSVSVAAGSNNRRGLGGLGADRIFGHDRGLGAYASCTCGETCAQQCRGACMHGGALASGHFLTHLPGHSFVDVLILMFCSVDLIPVLSQMPLQSPPHMHAHTSQYQWRRA